MLRKYELQISENNNPSDILLFLETVNKMKYYKDTNKDVIKFFRGMRSNWFPLCLLGLAFPEHDDCAVSNNARQLFTSLLRDKSCHSWYADVVYKSSYNGCWCVAFRCSKSEIDNIDAIMRLFHLEYQVRCK